MSHYNVAVIVEESVYDEFNEVFETEELKNILAPYDESIEVEPYISKTKEEIIDEGRERREQIIQRKANDPSYVYNDWEEEYIKADTDKKLYKLRTDDSTEYDENGNELSTYNPKSKWDWYTIGGRWSNELTVYTYCDRGYIQVDAAKISHIEFSMMDEGLSKNAERFWEIVVEKQEPKNENEKELQRYYRDKYFIEKYGTKENYININGHWHPFALVDSTGWYAAGEMHWFGIDDSTKEGKENFNKFFNEYIRKPENQGKYMVIVDCHI